MIGRRRSKKTYLGRNGAMVKLISLGLFVCIVGLGASASAEEHRPGRKRPVIEKVIIEKNGAWSDGVSSHETVADCAGFVLSDADVRDYFKKARAATQAEYVHDLLISRCYASGRVLLSGRREVVWEIDRARRGVLWLSNDDALFFYCGKCRSKVFWEACGIDCIHAD